jgi:hypothetical protein
MTLEQTRNNTEFCEKTSWKAVTWKTEDMEEQLSERSYERTTPDLLISPTLNELLRRALALMFLFTFFFFFFLYGAAVHIGPWPPLYEVP